VKDLALDKDTHDMYFDESDLHVVDDLDQVEQSLKERLLFYLREWFLDITAGVPYYTEVLIKNPNVPDIENILKSKILDTPNVLEILEFNSVFNNSARNFTVTFKSKTVYGDTSLLSISLFNN